MDIEKQTSQQRRDQLVAWEASRKGEKFQLLYTLLPTFFMSFSLAPSIYSICKHWWSVPVAEINALIAAMIPQVIWLVIYLHTWGSYVERLLEDIEAKIDGRVPRYYRNEDHHSFSRQPLHERLQKIEKHLSIDSYD